uniref:Uncharacterized protein n=1 Tax=Marseillevirus LCMAC103 TaxID=2506604 RepID=A0A481YUN2_9VIRU|nr:MAG: hypothetical protein LCMAC103_02300 [Marseillevirus LCMAC103]
MASAAATVKKLAESAATFPMSQPAHTNARILRKFSSFIGVDTRRATRRPAFNFQEEHVDHSPRG